MALYHTGSAHQSLVGRSSKECNQLSHGVGGRASLFPPETMIIAFLGLLVMGRGLSACVQLFVCGMRRQTPLPFAWENNKQLKCTTGFIVVVTSGYGLVRYSVFRSFERC